MDTSLVSHSTVTGTSSLLVLAAWVAAVVAAVVGVLHRVRATDALREELRALERKLAPPLAPAPDEARRSRPTFGAAFYQPTPSPLSQALSWHGATPTVIAAVFALAGAALMIARGGSGSAAGAAYQQELLGLRAAQDSLRLTVEGLRDSLALAAATPASSSKATATAAPSNRKAAASPRRQTIPSAPTGVLPASPTIVPGAMSAIPPAPVAP